MRHNKEVTSRIEGKKTLRAKFLADHAETLRPFVLPSVLDRIVREGKSSKRSRTSVKKITKQPLSIKADMRDYQLQGLDFMASMYQQNIPAILGDEMGLGKRTLDGVVGLHALSKFSPLSRV